MENAYHPCPFIPEYEPGQLFQMAEGDRINMALQRIGALV